LMRNLAVCTTTAFLALVSAASAQTAPAAPNAELQGAMTAYAAYQNDVTDLRASRISNDSELETAIERVARHNRDALTRGWVAYGASTAAQAPNFVQGVREAAAYYGRDAFIHAVSTDPRYARTLRGGDQATRLLLDSAKADSARVIDVADRYQEMAYGLQRQAWANAVAPGQAARVQRVRALGRAGAQGATLPAGVAPRLAVTPLSLTPGSDPTVFGGRRFWDALRGGPDVVQVSSNAPNLRWTVNVTRGEALDRMTSVAALQALDAVDTNQSAVSRLIADPRSRDCLEMAQLQLYQCMSAARFRYENAFCLGQHGLRDVGSCIGAVAEPTATAMTPITNGGGRD
jgi:hypothetical protein